MLRAPVQTSDDHCADIELIERISNRDQSAVGELYDRRSKLLYSLIVRIVRDRSQAEDVLQEVFLALWTRAHTYNRSLGSPVAWLVRIARNRAIDRLRSTGARTRVEVEAIAPDMTEYVTPEDSVNAGEIGCLVSKAMATLPSQQRALIEDAFYLGMTHAELADRYQMPLGTVKTRIRSGLQILRGALTEVKSIQ
jgi:RNA polymerase sigma-70 factor (ECF subfamily)